MKNNFSIKVIASSIPLLALLLVSLLILFAPAFGYWVNLPVSDGSTYFTLYLLIYLIVVLIGNYLIFKNFEFKIKPLKYLFSSIIILFFIVLYGFVVVNQILPTRSSSGEILLRKGDYSCDSYKPKYKEIIFYYEQTYKYDPTSTLPC